MCSYFFGSWRRCILASNDAHHSRTIGNLIDDLELLIIAGGSHIFSRTIALLLRDIVLLDEASRVDGNTFLVLYRFKFFDVVYQKECQTNGGHGQKRVERNKHQCDFAGEDSRFIQRRVPWRHRQLIKTNASPND